MTETETKMSDATRTWRDIFNGMKFLYFDHELKTSHRLCWRCYARFRRICKSARIVRPPDGQECDHVRRARETLFESCVSRCSAKWEKSMQARREREEQLKERSK